MQIPLKLLCKVAKMSSEILEFILGFCLGVIIGIYILRMLKSDIRDKNIALSKRYKREIERLEQKKIKLNKEFLQTLLDLKRQNDKGF